jgi:CheY-like chemotaxis protein
MTPDHGSEHPDFSGVTALVIDDDEASIHLLQACLEPFGARVVGAGSVAAAKRLIERETPNIVICDLVLSNETGLDFIHWLRARSAERGGKTPAIAVTFFYERFGVREARDAGFDMFVRKPIDPIDIVHALSVFVAQRETP